jgi:hypothetical protein
MNPRCHAKPGETVVNLRWTLTFRAAIYSIPPSA